MADWQVGWQCNECGKVYTADEIKFKTNKICGKCGSRIIFEFNYENKNNCINLMNITKIIYKNRLFQQPLIKEWDDAKGYGESK